MLGEDHAWSLLRDLRRPVAPSVSHADWSALRRSATPAARKILDLYLPLCLGEPDQGLVVAHLGQSLDGRVSTPFGQPRFITGVEDVRHTHRMRALFDVVLVGACTVEVDDPQLTTRLVPGEQPVRVVLDPRGRLPRDRRVFQDGLATTLVVVGKEAAGRYARSLPHVEELCLELTDGRLSLRALVRALGDRGLLRIFVEGGGVTVAHFLDEGLLDRLQVAVAPKVIGGGVPAIDLGDVPEWFSSLPFHSRSFLLGTDVLFDCDLRASAVAREPS